MIYRALFILASSAFLLLQCIRIARALHVFQLEGYKRERFLRWCRVNGSRALFLGPATQKKPLVMTGRAQRLLVTSTLLTTVAVVLAGLAGAAAGKGAAFTALLGAAVLCFVGVPLLLVIADVVLAPVQRSVNRGFMRKAQAKLQQVAPLVIGVTGSFGKTSTKFAIQRLLDGSGGRALATPGSFNTPLGVARTINEQLEARHKFFVVEMGAYGEGEIAELCAFVRPAIGVLTAIGPAHLDRFGSMDAIRRAKYEIVTSLPVGGTAVMNTDDPEVRRLADETSAVEVVRFGVDPFGKPAVTASEIDVTPTGTRFKITDARDGSSLRVSTQLLGSHSLGHILAAVAVARVAGSALADLESAIASLVPVEHRLEILNGSGGVTVIDDAYNSNPEGAAAALDLLAAMPATRRVVVSPGMIELGERQFEENVRFGERAAKIADVFVVVAKVNREAIMQGARSAGTGKVMTVDSLAEATDRLQGMLGPGDVVLFENDLPDHYES